LHQGKKNISIFLSLLFFLTKKVTKKSRLDECSAAQPTHAHEQSGKLNYSFAIAKQDANTASCYAKTPEALHSALLSILLKLFLARAE
jgi:hypothetical protein